MEGYLETIDVDEKIPVLDIIETQGTLDEKCKIQNDGFLVIAHQVQLVYVDVAELKALLKSQNNKE